VKLSIKLHLKQAVYSVEGLAEELPFGRSFIYQELRSGRLTSKKVGGKRIILAPQAIEWLASFPDGYEAVETTDE